MKSADVEVVELPGEYDITTLSDLRQSLNDPIDRGVRMVIVGLEQTQFLDSSSIGVFIGAARRLRELDGQLVLRSPSMPVRRVLELTGLTDYFVVT